MARTMGSRPFADPLSGGPYSAVELAPDADAVFMMDQRRLPEEETYVELRTAADVASGIRDMVVRGAPAIGIAAAYGMVLAAKAAANGSDEFVAELDEAAAHLSRSRPTAVNLFWAIQRMQKLARDVAGRSASERLAAFADAARTIHAEDVAACKAMGAHGAEWIPEGATVLTHCNAGALATGGYGTALGVIRAAYAAGKVRSVFADETRPYWQGARLTAWELHHDQIPVEVIADSMAGHFMQRGEIDAVVVGADRIADNGDVANKIGTYAVAQLARAHDIPFLVAAPHSTLDRSTPDGHSIPIEMRSAEEMTHVGSVRLVPEGVGVRHPAFDVTPARLITRVVTETGCYVPGRWDAPA